MKIISLEKNVIVLPNHQIVITSTLKKIGTLADSFVELQWLWIYIFAPSAAATAAGKKDPCYYPHWSRESLSPICRIFFCKFNIF